MSLWQFLFQRRIRFPEQLNISGGHLSRGWCVLEGERVTYVYLLSGTFCCLLLSIASQLTAFFFFSLLGKCNNCRMCSAVRTVDVDWGVIMRWWWERRAFFFLISLLNTTFACQWFPGKAHGDVVRIWIQNEGCVKVKSGPGISIIEFISEIIIRMVYFMGRCQS